LTFLAPITVALDALSTPARFQRRQAAPGEAAAWAMMHA
jgi:hypothetical protein